MILELFDSLSYLKVTLTRFEGKQISNFNKVVNNYFPCMCDTRYQVDIIWCLDILLI